MSESADSTALRPADFPVLRRIPLRWDDVDAYGHVNNSVHYALMDTAINELITEATGTHPTTMPALGVVAETGCQYLREIGPNHTPELGIAVERIGRSSVVYRVAFFIDDAAPAALARFVHVYIDPVTRAAMPIPTPLREALLRLQEHSTP